MNLVGRTISALLTGYATTFLLLTGALVALGFPWERLVTLAALVAIVFPLILLIFLPAAVLLRAGRRGPTLRGSLALGIVSALLPFTAATYVMEGFEYGIVPLLLDPGSWVWLAAFFFGGAVLGWVYGRNEEPEVGSKSTTPHIP